MLTVQNRSLEYSPLTMGPVIQTTSSSSVRKKRQTAVHRSKLKGHSVPPSLVDDGEVGSGADVVQDVGVLVAGEVQGGVVGLTHGQEVGGMVACGQLDDVSDESCGTQAEHVHP